MSVQQEKPIARRPDWKELHRLAANVKRVRTNPASYKPEELDMPLVGNNNDH